MVLLRLPVGSNSSQLNPLKRLSESPSSDSLFVRKSKRVSRNGSSTSKYIPITMFVDTSVKPLYIVLMFMHTKKTKLFKKRQTQTGRLFDRTLPSSERKERWRSIVVSSGDVTPAKTEN